MRTALVCLFAFLSTAAHAQSTPGPSVEAQLCRSQLDLLTSGNKLSAEEIARFQSQCDCLEDRNGDADPAQCAQPREDI